MEKEHYLEIDKSDELFKGIRAEDARVVITIILTGLSLLVAMILETIMTKLAFLEILIIFAGALYAFGVFFGHWIEAESIYRFNVVFFAIALANLLWLFNITDSFLPFMFGTLVGVSGILMCISGSKSIPRVETYEINKKKPR